MNGRKLSLDRRTVEDAAQMQKAHSFAWVRLDVTSSDGGPMHDLTFVMQRIAAGDRVRFRRDYYGQQWIELSRGRILKRKTKVNLPPEEILQVKTALQARRQGADAAAT